MTLISNLEEKFGITFSTDDIVDFSSYKKGMEIIKNYIKYSFSVTLKISKSYKLY